jgi:hypothetical protein
VPWIHDHDRFGRVLEHLVGENLALLRLDAFGDVVVDRDEAAVLQRLPLDMEHGAVRADPIEAMRSRVPGAIEQALREGLRLAGAVFTPLRIEEQDVAQGRGSVGKQRVGQVEQALEFVVVCLNPQLGSTSDTPQGMLSRIVCRILLRRSSSAFGILLRGDVRVRGDEAGDLAVNIHRLACDEVGPAVRSRTFEAVSLELSASSSFLSDLFRRIARAILPLFRERHDQVFERCVAVQQFRREGVHLGEFRVPVLQPQVFVKNADALGQVIQYGRQIRGLTAQLLFDRILDRDVLERAAGLERLAVPVGFDVHPRFEATYQAVRAHDPEAEFGVVT